jgi:hypothetical protein
MPTFNFTTQTTLAIRDDIKGNIPPGTIHTIEQCFVDLNMELNENVNTSFPKKTASFRKGLYNLSEGSVDNIYVDLGKDIFCPGQGYVALSRCRNLNSLHIKTFIPSKIYPDKKALEFERTL